MPGSFEIVDESAATPAGEAAWRVEARAREGVFLTFELPEQMVGLPVPDGGGARPARWSSS